MTDSRRKSSSASGTPDPFRFPKGYQYPANNDSAIADSPLLSDHETHFEHIPLSNASHRGELWQPKRKAGISWSNGTANHSRRQKSLSEALRTIRGRRASVSENAHEIAEALKAPISPKLVILSAFWFMTSIFSNASSKAILIAFRYPVTLTLVQFAFVSSWCVAASLLAQRFPVLQTWVPALKYSIRPPSRDLIVTTLPLTAFQFGGHILNSDAMARIPVSLVHTIKGLSPLFTVLAYRFYFRRRYSTPTYLSLVPLTLGVVMACSANFTADGVGLLFAFGSTVLFVTQNIVSKRLFTEADRAESEGVGQFQAAKKPDKLNLLCYSSGLAFLFTFPLWIWSEGFGLIKDLLVLGSVELSQRPDALDHGRLSLEFIFNGTFHFAQSLVAFVLLSLVSPVTYSVASLIKRVFVIVFAIVWFGNPMTQIQGIGIGFTFVGLYLYDRTSDSSRADRRAHGHQSHARAPLLPLVKEHKLSDEAVPSFLPANGSFTAPAAHTNGGIVLPDGAQKRDDNAGATSRRGGNTRGLAAEGWLPPGTKQESTWNVEDLSKHSNGAVT